MCSFGALFGPRLVQIAAALLVVVVVVLSNTRRMPSIIAPAERTERPTRSDD